MEYIPALAILSGIGAHYLAQLFKRPLVKTLIVLMFLPLTVKLVSIHPNEGVYFNPLMGGLKGAQEKNIPDWGQSLGNPYRQGVKWLNQNAEENASLAFGFELMANIPNVWLRKDIKFTNFARSGPLRKGEYVISVVNECFTQDWYLIRYLEKFLIPVYQAEV